MQQSNNSQNFSLSCKAVYDDFEKTLTKIDELKNKNFEKDWLEEKAINELSSDWNDLITMFQKKIKSKQKELKGTWLSEVYGKDTKRIKHPLEPKYVYFQNVEVVKVRAKSNKPFDLTNNFDCTIKVVSRNPNQKQPQQLDYTKSITNAISVIEKSYRNIQSPYITAEAVSSAFSGTVFLETGNVANEADIYIKVLNFMLGETFFLNAEKTSLVYTAMYLQKQIITVLKQQEKKASIKPQKKKKKKKRVKTKQIPNNIKINRGKNEPLLKQNVWIPQFEASDYPIINDPKALNRHLNVIKWIDKSIAELQFNRP